LTYPSRISYVLPGSDEWKTVEGDFWQVSLWTQWHHANDKVHNFNDRLADLFYTKSGAKGRKPLADFPESEFKTDSGYIRVKAFSMEYTNGKEHITLDGEVPRHSIQECRAALSPFTATLLV